MDDERARVLDLGTVRSAGVILAMEVRTITERTRWRCECGHVETLDRRGGGAPPLHAGCPRGRWAMHYAGPARE